MANRKRDRRDDDDDSGSWRGGISRPITSQPRPVPVVVGPSHSSVMKTIATLTPKADRQSDRLVEPGAKGVVLNPVNGRKVPAPLRASIAERFVSRRVEHPAGPVLSASQVAKGEVVRKPEPMATRKPGEFVTAKRGKAPRMDVEKSLHSACVARNRPTDTKGNGDGRPFVPWCQKGKRK